MSWYLAGVDLRVEMLSMSTRKVTLEVANEIRKKQENPLIGEWRMHAALLQEGIDVGGNPQEATSS